MLQSLFIVNLLHIYDITLMVRSQSFLCCFLFLLHKLMYANKADK